MEDSPENLGRSVHRIKVDRIACFDVQSCVSVPCGPRPDAGRLEFCGDSGSRGSWLNIAVQRRFVCVVAARM